MKTCIRCKEPKQEKDFYKNARGGRKPACIKCCREREEKRRRSNGVKPKPAPISQDAQYYRVRENVKRSKLRLETSREGKSKCECCLGYIKKPDMYNKTYCRWCRENRKNFNLYTNGKIAKRKRVKGV